MDNDGYFDCALTSYEVLIPGDFDCEICTFEWLWKKDPTKIDIRRSCSDFHSLHKTIGSYTRNANALNYHTKEKAQDFLDHLNKKKEFEERSWSWVLMIASFLLALILTIVCCLFCSKKRDMYYDMDSHFNRNIALHLTQESRDYY